MKKKKFRLIIFLLILFISIGFAYLSTNLSLFGTGIFKQNSWDIYFDNITEETYKSEVIGTTEIDNKTTINFSVNLDSPGSTYTMYANIVNDGSIDAMLDSWNLTNTMDENEAKAIDIKVTYSDGVEFTKNDLLKAKSFDTIKVVVTYKKDISNSELLTSEGDLDFSLTMNYVQADEDGLERDTSEVVVTYDYNDVLAFDTTGKYMDTGFSIVYNKDFKVHEEIHLDTSIKNRYLILGNYNNINADTMNIELYNGLLRTYFRKDSLKNETKSTDVLDDCDNLIVDFSWNADLSNFYYSVKTSTSTITINNSVTSLGTDVGNTLRIGSHDNRSGSPVFKPITYNILKISRNVDTFSNYYLPNPVRDGYTFDGWYTDTSFTNKVLSTDKVNRNITLYAKWIAN